MRCQLCKKPLSSAQVWRGNQFCSKSCARRADWAKRERADRMTSGGYAYVKVDGKWVLEHRYVMSQVLGRPLERHEKVIHKDRNHLNNDPTNLELWRVRLRDPSGVRAADYHCPGCRCFEPPKVRYISS
jgi:hypothetical protein